MYSISKEVDGHVLDCKISTLINNKTDQKTACSLIRHGRNDSQTNCSEDNELQRQFEC